MRCCELFQDLVLVVARDFMFVPQIEDVDAFSVFEPILFDLFFTGYEDATKLFQRKVKSD